MAKLQQGSLSWKKSTASGGGACVEVARVGEMIIVRDSKDVLGSVLTFSEEEWRTFLAGTRSGQFNI
jgi:predicted secreted Zn-dependent protease